MDGLVLRTVGVGDGAVLRAVTLRSVEEAAYAFGGGETLGEELARPVEEWEGLARECAGLVEAWRDRCAGFLVMEGERARGKLLVYFGKRTEVALVSAVWVDPEVRRRGAGRAMMEAAMAWAHGKGAARMALWVDETNPEGEVFYERLGFVATGERRAVREGAGVFEREFGREIVG